MPNVTKLALAAAIVLSTAATASAATKTHRASPRHPPIYNTAPPIINDACQPVGPPCRTHVDSA